LLGLIVLVEEALSKIFQPSIKPIRLGCEAHFFHFSKAGIGDMQKSVFLGAVKSHFIGPATAIVNKLDFNFLAYAFQVAITPDLKRIGFSLSAAFFFRALVRSAHGMRINRSGRSKHDINSSAISFPAR